MKREKSKAAVVENVKLSWFSVANCAIIFHELNIFLLILLTRPAEL